MGFYLGLPRRRYYKVELVGIFLVALFFTLNSIEILNRSETNMEDQKESCGEVLKYYYNSKGKGHHTWRLAIMSHKYGKEVYKVGEKYIQNGFKSIDIIKGEKVCVRYISSIEFDNPFITQITFNGVGVISEKDMIKTFLRPLNIISKISIVIFWLLFFVKLIRFKKVGL